MKPSKFAWILGGMAIFVASSAGAQSVEQTKAIAESLKQRLEPVKDNIVDPQTAATISLL